MKKITAFTLVCLIFISTFCIPGFATDAEIVESGSIRQISWTLDNAGVLTVSGSGETWGIEISLNSIAKIKTIVIEEGITVISNGQFQGCRNLTSVTIPSSVTKIESRAFSACSKLSELVIPESLTDIEPDAFSGCFALADENGLVIVNNILFSYDSKNPDVIIPDNVSVIAENCFTENPRIRSIKIPEGITEIPSNAFTGCSNLTKVILPSSVKSIGYHAFSDCGRLSEINITDNITEIGPGAFYGCYSLLDEDGYCIIGDTLYCYNGKETSITIPDCVKNICSDAFRSCRTIKHIIVPESIKEISNSAFRSCLYLESITFLGDIDEVGNYAFSGCEHLSEITFSGTVPRFGSGAFERCFSLADKNNFVIIDNTLYAYVGYETDIVISDGVTSIADRAFENRAFEGGSLSSVVIPEGVVSIGDGSFLGNENLCSVTLPETLTSIGGSAFDGCSNLTDINIPDGVINIGIDAFRGCFGLADEDGFVIVKDTLYNYIGESSSVVIPSGVTAIDSYIFYYNPSAITEIIIPESVNSIGVAAFSGCDGITEINIPESVNSIGDRAFRGCSGITEINIPESVNSIGYAAFSGCYGLADEDGFVIVEGILFDYYGEKEKVVIPKGVTRIDGCVSSSVVSITIPDGVKHISDYAFSAGGIERISIPSSVEYIGYISPDESLTKISYDGSEEDWIRLLENSGHDAQAILVEFENNGITMDYGSSVLGSVKNEITNVLDSEDSEFSRYIIFIAVGLVLVVAAIVIVVVIKKKKKKNN